jgi:hypothetical protein
MSYILNDNFVVTCFLVKKNDKMKEIEKRKGTNSSLI